MKSLIQFIKFSLVGVMNTVISYVIYVVLMYFGMHYLLADFISFFLSVINAFYWNNKYVFVAAEDKEKRVWWKALIKTYVAYTGGYIVGALILFLLMDVIKLAAYMEPLAQICISRGYERFDVDFLAGALAAIIRLVITVPLNYFTNKLWAFRQKKLKESTEGDSVTDKNE